MQQHQGKCQPCPLNMDYALVKPLMWHVYTNVYNNHPLYRHSRGDGNPEILIFPLIPAIAGMTENFRLLNFSSVILFNLLFDTIVNYLRKYHSRYNR